MKKNKKSGENPKRLLNTAETAEFLGLGKSTLEQDRLYGRLGIPYVRMGRSIRYRREDLEAYISNLPSFIHTSGESAQ